MSKSDRQTMYTLGGILLMFFLNFAIFMLGPIDRLSSELKNTETRLSAKIDTVETKVDILTGQVGIMRDIITGNATGGETPPAMSK